MKKTARNIGICLSVVLAVCLGFLLCKTAAQASGLVDEKIDAVHLFSKYPLKNYRLDFYVSNSGGWLPWNWGDSIGKSVMYGLYCLADFLWFVSLQISKATGYVVQEAYKLDIVGDMVDKIGKNLQSLAGITKKGIQADGLYVKMILLIIIIVGIYMAYTGLIKRETSKAVRAFLNLVLVFTCSAAFIAYAPDYMTMLNEFSSDLSTEVLDVGTDILSPGSKKSKEESKKESVYLIRDSLFAMQVENPWLLLQYGTTDKEEIGEERIEKLLSVSPSRNKGEDREKVVKAEIEEEDNLNLTITEVVPRLGMVLFIVILNVIISVFVLLLTGIMILSQILFLIFSLVLAVSFLISMIPGQENNWKKAVVNLFNTLMARAGITLIITLAFCISNMLYSMSAAYPFVLTMFLQIVVFVGIFLKMNDILGTMSLRANDSEQLGRRIFYQPYRRSLMRGRRMGRTAVRKIVSGVKGKDANIHRNIQSNHADIKTMGGNKPGTYQKKSRDNVDKQSGENTKAEPIVRQVGKKAGTVADAGGTVAGKTRHLAKQVKDLPVNVQYKAYEIGDHVKEGVETGVTDMRSAYRMERSKRKNDRMNRETEYQQNMTAKRAAMEERKKAPKRQNVKRIERKPLEMNTEKGQARNQTSYRSGRERDAVKNSATEKNMSTFHNMAGSMTSTVERTNQSRKDQKNISRIAPDQEIENSIKERTGKNVPAWSYRVQRENLHNVSARKNQNIRVRRETPKIKSVSQKSGKEPGKK